MRVIRFFPQGIRLYFKRLRGVLPHIHCSDVDSGMVEPESKLGYQVKIGYEVKVSKDAEIGRYTYVENYSTVICAKIGQFCSIGERCLLGPWQHHYKLACNSPILYRNILGVEYDDTPKPAEIGNDVWIGSNSVVMGGVKIGNGAIVGAGSIVTKDVKPYSIVAGNPAKEIGMRFSEERIKDIEASGWWNWSEDRIKENKDFFIARKI